MNCAEIRILLHAYADGELDLVRNLEVEQHLKSCARCAAEIKSLQSLRSALRENDLVYRAPNALRKEMRQMEIRQTARRSSGTNQWPWIWKCLAFGATAFAIVTIVLRSAGVSDRDQLVEEVVESHVRSLQVNHLMDVVSSDQHTVKPWFDGKLDFAPDVKDFAAQGFPLIGGRLDYLDGRTVAALIYKRNKHFINVFIWPENNQAAPATESYRGYSIINFAANNFHYCLVSDLNGKELGELANLLGKGQ